jgi:hypothetical protein
MNVIAYFTIEQLCSCSESRLLMLIQCLVPTVAGSPRSAISIDGGLYTSGYDILRKRSLALSKIVK